MSIFRTNASRSSSRGSDRRFRIRTVSDDEKAEMLKAYLDRYKAAVQRFSPVPAGSDARAFRQIADRYPVLELLPANDTPPR